MKQNITLDQFNKLSDKAKENLDKWFLQKGYYDEEYNHGLLVSIGQMLEFLDEQSRWFLDLNHDPRLDLEQLEGIESPEPRGYRVQVGLTEYFKPELCDALFEAVKEILNTS